jgi:iron complex transport system substrate-binding protein
MNRVLIFLCIFLCLTGCTLKNPERTSSDPTSSSSDSLVTLAKGFDMIRQGRGYRITVRNPWQNARGVEYHYILSDSLAASRMVDEFTWYIKTPVKRVICLSTTHIGFIDCLQQTNSIAGISGKDFVVNEKIRLEIAEEKIFDVGYDENLNYELILKLKPDVVFAYGVSVSVTNTIRKLNDLGIPVILIGEYLEQKPLAKTEWLKVFAACYGQNRLAVQVFDSTTNRYNRLAELAQKAQNKPSVLLGLPWRGNWYISGSKSYIARLISDAGGRYIFDHMDFNESRPMALEEIYENALTAEFWIDPGDARHKEDILQVDERFGDLPSFRSGQVFNNNRIVTRQGGNAFYESGVVEPDIILSDLIAILHPQLLPSHEAKYYIKLQ